MIWLSKSANSHKFNADNLFSKHNLGSTYIALLVFALLYTFALGHVTLMARIGHPQGELGVLNLPHFLMETDTTIVAARAFTRNLNILLKTARLYGVEHERTALLLQAAWSELQAALKSVGDGGLLLGVSGSQVLLDGVPLEPRPTDRSFAQLLSSAGLSSIDFSPRVTCDHFSRFVRVFATRRLKTGPLMDELKAALADNGQPTIRINEIRFVAQDAATADTALAAQLAVRSLGSEAGKLQAWLSDPKKLLQLMAAAEGARGGPAASAEGAPGGPVVSASQEGASRKQSVTSSLQENDVMSILGVLCELGQAGRSSGGQTDPGKFEQKLNQVPGTAHATITEALASLVAASPTLKTNTPLLLQLAEHIAIRFALERYERGDASVNSVVQLLDRMKREIKTLRKILQEHEERMGRAGLEVESHAELIDREFWAVLPESAKSKILRSPEAWAIPPVNIRLSAGQLLDRGDAESARDILLNYATCVHAVEPEARRKTSLGLTDLADVYVRANGSLLESAIGHIGEQLKAEGITELQTLLGACFVRFSHEAAAKHLYPAVGQVLTSLDGVEKEQPKLAQLLWPRIKVGNRIQEFVEDAVLAPHVSEDLMDVLRRMPDATLEHAASRLGRCTRREECDRLVAVVHELGADGIAQLRKKLIDHPPQEAVSVVALLTRLEPQAIEELLSLRLRQWDQIYHDQVVGQVSLGGAPGRGRLLASLLGVLDPLVLPEALDEIGMSGEQTAARELLNIVEEGQERDPLVRIKAIEALGRLRDPHAAPLLRPLVEAKQLLRWRHPRELRISAAQALQKIDPEWAKSFLPSSGLSEAELRLVPLDPVPTTPWVRQRRYERIQLPRIVTGLVSSAQGDCPMAIKGLSLGGGVATCQLYLRPGVVTSVALRAGLGRVHAEVLVREVRPQQLSFELVKIGLEDRNKLRRPLARYHWRAS